jgi:hypothetical protein
LVQRSDGDEPRFLRVTASRTATKFGFVRRIGTPLVDETYVCVPGIDTLNQGYSQPRRTATFSWCTKCTSVTACASESLPEPITKLGHLHAGGAFARLWNRDVNQPLQQRGA